MFLQLDGLLIDKRKQKELNLSLCDFELIDPPTKPLTLYKAIVKIAPMWIELTFAFSVQMFLEIINMMIVARLNDTVALAAVGLGNIILIMFVLAFLFGMNSALETLVS